MTQAEKDDILREGIVSIPRFDNIENTTLEERFKLLEDYNQKEIKRLFYKIRKIVREDVVATN